MMLADEIYLLVCRPQDGLVGTLEYTRVKRCLQGALAWELAEQGALAYAEGKVSLGPAADGHELAETFRHLKGQSGPIPIDHLIFRLDNEKGTTDAFFARRLHALGLLDQKEVTRMLVFHSTAYPRNPAGEARVAQFKARLEKATDWLKGGSLPPDPAAAVGAVLLDLLALGGQERLPKSAPRRLADEGMISRDLLQVYPQLTQGVEVGDLLWGALDLLGN